MQVTQESNYYYVAVRYVKVEIKHIYILLIIFIVLVVSINVGSRNV